MSAAAAHVFVFILNGETLASFLAHLLFNSLERLERKVAEKLKTCFDAIMISDGPSISSAYLHYKLQ